MGDCTDTAAFAEAVAQLTTAFGDATRRSIYLRCREGGEGVTAAQVAAEFELHPNVARHHLDKLIEGGYLVVESRRPPGGDGPVAGAGRPSKRYRPTGKDVMVSYPTRRDDLLVALLAQALDSLEPVQATALAERVGYDYGRAVAADVAPGAGPTTFRKALAVVGDALTAHGFDASVQTEGRWHATITAGHCPFGAAAHSHPHLICALDRGMVKGMLSVLYGETCPETTASLPEGDQICRTHV